MKAPFPTALSPSDKSSALARKGRCNEVLCLFSRCEDRACLHHRRFIRNCLDNGVADLSEQQPTADECSLLLDRGLPGHGGDFAPNRLWTWPHWPRCT